MIHFRSKSLISLRILDVHKKENKNPFYGSRFFIFFFNFLFRFSFALLYNTTMTRRSPKGGGAGG